MPDDEIKLASFFAQYDPAIAQLAQALRGGLRARLPGLFEIVYLYPRQRALLLTYSPTERGYQGLCSLGVYPQQVLLHFGQGARLAHADPYKLLRGSGNVVRHVVLNDAQDLERADIETLMVAALALAAVRPVAGAHNQLIIKAEEQQKRARRGANAK